jgi:hypothetical protein
MSVLVLAPSAIATTSATNPFTDLPIEGTVNDTSFTEGILDITHFIVRNGDLFAVGRLTIPDTNVRDATIELSVGLPASDSFNEQVCDIFTLMLGPLHLDLLGLVIDLGEVNLTITDEAGPGNLLGNLLCALAGLLDNGLLLNLVVGLLNLLIDVFEQLGLWPRLTHS